MTVVYWTSKELDDCVPEVTDSGVDFPECDGLNSVDVGGGSEGGLM